MLLITLGHFIFKCYHSKATHARNTPFRSRLPNEAMTMYSLHRHIKASNCNLNHCQPCLFIYYELICIMNRGTSTTIQLITLEVNHHEMEIRFYYPFKDHIRNEFLAVGSNLLILLLYLYAVCILCIVYFSCIYLS